MPDVYAMINEVDEATLDQVAQAMEISAADPQHLDMLRDYLSDLGLDKGAEAPTGGEARARVLEIGCGTGAISRVLAGLPGVREVVGADPSAALLDRARSLSSTRSNLSFLQADGRDLPLPEADFDVVVLHRVLSHVPGPQTLLAQAHRVLRPGGRLAVFDGDYSTITLATGPTDPLQTCVDAFIPAYITDPWLVRRLPALLDGAGFTHGRLRSHGFAQIEDPGYMLTIADRGAEALVAAGRIGQALADALKAEARRRVSDHTFFGHIAYASLTARRATG
ncbi:methyltransferase domain-containing protein [Streptomyces sp. 15-116A]|uniref:methyltransferase domain-containing protein n=1 Tax=Streptomyces sp. 15-116A TaxID=2259035 RepID=UPI0021B2EE68|nr:methyltransferase domain-containing protein [Streptomyces sp. 15-116A]MCT7350884.1 methyltransferase domain-containing protein [Streptomyces sp. 15-116A]